MYERFTDGARKVMQLANQEAQRSNCPYIDCWHILAGLLLQGVGIAAHVLTSLGVQVKAVRGIAEAAGLFGSDMVPMGKLPQTPLSKKVIEFAMEEARALHHNYVGTEHILLGLLRMQDSSVTMILERLAVSSGQTRQAALQLLEGSVSGPQLGNADLQRLKELFGTSSFDDTMAKAREVAEQAYAFANKLIPSVYKWQPLVIRSSADLPKPPDPSQHEQ